MIMIVSKSFVLFFMFLLRDPIAKNSHIFAEIYLIFQKNIWEKV